MAANLYIGSTIPKSIFLGSTSVKSVWLGSVKVWPTGYPIMANMSITAVGITTLSVSGNITGDGGTSVTDRGFCWSTSSNPTITDGHIHVGSGTGSFSDTITGLSANTTYHIRAFATNSAGTSYSNDVSQLTADYNVPTVEIASISNITGISAQANNNVSSDGGATVTARGVCWSIYNDPTIDDDHTTDSSGTGSFSSSITGLTGETRYYVRAYATNSIGTAYSDETYFDSANANLPDINQLSFPDRTGTTITIVTGVSENGGGSITERGICWSDSSDMPTKNDSHVSVTPLTGTVSKTITGLTPSTYYYWRAYATNANGTTYLTTPGFGYSTTA